jgi:sortase A
MKPLQWKPFFRGLFVAVLVLCVGASLSAWQLFAWLDAGASFDVPTVMLAALPSSLQSSAQSSSQPHPTPTMLAAASQMPTPTPTALPTLPRLSATYEARISEPMTPPTPTVHLSAIVTKTLPLTPTPTPTPTPNDVSRPADRKLDYSWLAPLRAQPFPTPAQAQPNRLVIPSINLDSKVIETRWRTVQQNGKTVNLWNVADYAVGFHFNSALPGAVGNTVMAGHNNIRGQVFRNLNNTKLGDEIFVFVGTEGYRYIVTEKHLIKEAGATLAEKLQNVNFIGPTDDVRLTLVSCWPYTSNTHRIIVIAKPRR